MIISTVSSLMEAESRGGGMVTSQASCTNDTGWSCGEVVVKRSRVLRQVAQATDPSGSSRCLLPKKLQSARGQAR